MSDPAEKPAENSGEPTKTAAKKEAKRLEAERKKKEKAEAAAKKDQEQQERRLEESKKVQITMDKNLPEPLVARIRDCPNLTEKRVKVFGYVHRLRQQGYLV